CAIVTGRVSGIEMELTSLLQLTAAALDFGQRDCLDKFLAWFVLIPTYSFHRPNQIDAHNCALRDSHRQGWRDFFGFTEKILSTKSLGVKHGD
ncbi:MAG: hypothetical protein JW750_10085, partial [Anaerolineaceae bacterium]|nr:hypothetical protein [Anaerolineaceae bacterium]